MSTHSRLSATTPGRIGLPKLPFFSFSTDGQIDSYWNVPNDDAHAITRANRYATAFVRAVRRDERAASLLAVIVRYRGGNRDAVSGSRRTFDTFLTLVAGRLGR